jgi:IS5 family transposase
MYTSMARNTIPRRAPGLFDIDNRLAELAQMGDCLARLDSLIDWNLFVQAVEPLVGSANSTTAGGRPAYSTTIMLKLLILQRLHNLSDEQTQFQACDRLSYQRFLGLTLADRIPDRNTLREFREKLVKADAFQQLFDIFGARLRAKGFIPKEGSVIDASFVEVPRQRNRREENRQIKNGVTPPEWEEKPAKLAQKDVDARWAIKNEEVHFGYKNHIKIDVRSKLIEKASVTSAEVHDSQELGRLVEAGDGLVFADSAYKGQPVAEKMEAVGAIPAVAGKSKRGAPLSAFQKQFNKGVSRVRARVEHVFGAMVGDAGRLFQRHIGFARNRAGIILLNLVYNLRRYEQIVRLALMRA